MIPKGYTQVAIISRMPGDGGAWLIEDVTDRFGGEGGNHSAHTALSWARKALRRDYGYVRYEKINDTFYYAYADVGAEERE